MPDKDAWVIRDVDDETRRRVKAYAAENRTTIAEALKRLVTIALDKSMALKAARVPGMTQEQLQQVLYMQLSPELEKAIADEVARQIKQREE